MKKVITYGTYDLLHYGHIRLLERAKALGDYLIVGVTTDDFDKVRGKINVSQSLMERVEAVRNTGIADEIIIEEYEGQKIDDIKRYGVDVFTVGSDWVGKFDYLKDYCEVVYLDRTEGISSSDIREEKRSLKLGIVGETLFLNKVYSESEFVDGINISGICTKDITCLSDDIKALPLITDKLDELLRVSDALYIRSQPGMHYGQIKQALLAGKHVLCESPITLDEKECQELFDIAKANNLILMEAIKTAYSTAYSRMLLMIKSGKIGEVVSVDATCTSLRHTDNDINEWDGINEWAPTALLPIFQILGTNYNDSHSFMRKFDNRSFVKIDFEYDKAVSTVKIGDAVKSEGELIISGTKGYIYVPSPWWNMDYFEIRYEDMSKNLRSFYQLEGEGIRYELVSFANSVDKNKSLANTDKNIAMGIANAIKNVLGEY